MSTMMKTLKIFRKQPTCGRQKRAAWRREASDAAGGAQNDGQRPHDHLTSM